MLLSPVGFPITAIAGQGKLVGHQVFLDFLRKHCLHSIDRADTAHPQVPVLADRAQIEAGDAERLAADLAVPAVESRRRAPCHLSAAGFSSPLTEPDVRLSLRIRLSRRHGKVRLSHPCEAVSADRGPGEHMLLDRPFLPDPPCRAYATG